MIQKRRVWSSFAAIVVPALMVGCHARQGAAPQTKRPVSATMPTTQPATEPTGLATARPVTGVVAKKPFIAVRNPLKRDAQPSVLLLQHARTDSPVPLVLYAKQPVHDVAEFKLRPTLSAGEVQQRLGPPAQLADYSEPWMIYRLGEACELWLRFDEPGAARLLYADVIGPAEDGYRRTRVFAYDGSR